MTRSKSGTPITTVRVSAAGLRGRFGDLLNAAKFGRQVTEITRHGKCTAVLIPPELYDRIPADVLAEFKAAA